MAEPKVLEQLVDEADRLIEKLITNMFVTMRAKGKEVGLMVHLIGTAPDGEPFSAVMMDGTGDQDTFMEAVRDKATEVNAVWAAIISEGWTLSLTDDDKPTLLIREHPDRKECLILVVEGPLGQRMVQWIIEGKGKGARLGERTETADFHGRFSHILPPTTTTN